MKQVIPEEPKDTVLHLAELPESGYYAAHKAHDNYFLMAWPNAIHAASLYGAIDCWKHLTDDNFGTKKGWCEKFLKDGFKVFYFDSRLELAQWEVDVVLSR